MHTRSITGTVMNLVLYRKQGWWGWILLWVESTIVALVSYRKQGVVGVDLALGGKYSYGPRFAARAGGGGGGLGSGRAERFEPRVVGRGGVGWGGARRWGVCGVSGGCVCR